MVRLKKRVLCVDDEESILELNKEFLERSGVFSVEGVESAEKALVALKKESFDAIVCDYQMPTMNGLELLETLRKEGNGIPFIIFTGRGREEIVLRAYELGVDFYLQKGGDPRPQYAELEQKLARVLRERELEAAALEQRRLQEEMFDTVPDEVAVVRLRDMTVININAQSLKGMQKTKEEVLNKKADFLLSFVEPREGELMMSMLKEKGAYNDLEMMVRRPSGEMAPYIFSGRLVEVGGEPCLISVVRDISSWKETERKMLESEMRFNRIFESANLGIHTYELDEVGNLIFTGSNVAADEILGIDHDSLVGKPIEEAFPPLANTEVPENYRRVSQHGGTWHKESLEYTDERVSGAFDVHAFQVGKGQLMVMFRDITDEYATQQKLQGASGSLSKVSSIAMDLAGASSDMDVYKVVAEQIMGLADVAFISFSEFDAERNVMVSKAMHGMGSNLQRIVRILGMSPVGMEFPVNDDQAKAQMLTGKLGKVEGGLERLTFGQFPKRMVSLSERMLKVGEVYAIGFVRQGELLGNSAIVLKKGSRLDSKVVEAIYYQASIALQRRKAEHELRESERRYRTLVENTMDIVYSITPEGTITFVSPQANRYGYRPQELTGKNFLGVIFPDDRATVAADLREQMGRGDVISSSFRVVAANGAIIWMENHGRVIRDAKGRALLMTGVLRDVNERKRSDEALQLANKKLALIGSITRHDLANDLVALHGHLELTKRSEQSPDSRKHIESMDRVLERMRSEIDFAKQYERMGLRQPEWQEVKEVVHQARSQIDLKDVELSDEIQGFQVLADPMLPRVFLNLMDNSLRHGGKVTKIKIFAKQEKDELVLVYEDDGAGLTSADRKYLFEKGHGKNTGLGLFLCKEVLQLTGIGIEERKTLGKGVRFEIRVPPDHYRPVLT